MENWRLFFKTDEFDPKNIEKIEVFKNHFKNFQHWYDFDKINETSWFTLPIENIQNDRILMKCWKSFNLDLSQDPESVLSCIGFAMYQALKETTDVPNGKKIIVRITGLTPISTFDLFSSNRNGNLVTLQGIVIKIEPPQINCKWMSFTCALCHSELTIRQKTGQDMIQPMQCLKSCPENLNFIPNLSSPYTSVVKSQIIHIREAEKSAFAKTIQVEVSHELVDTQNPGKYVIVTGILRTKKAGKFTRGSSDHKFDIKAISVSSVEEMRFNFQSQSVNEKYFKGINLVKSEPSPFRALVHSLCPEVVGKEIAKAALLLGLFGGSQLLKNRRSEIHVLLVGDPGIGKSHLVQKCAEVSRKSTFTCGKSNTSITLSPTISANGMIEVGALSLANEGVCCVDEFEKLSASNSYECLLEVMDQQKITALKNGVKAVMEAKTSILAAANPAGGYYDRSKSLVENLKIPMTILSRFDLVHVMLNTPDQEHDLMVVKNKRPTDTNPGHSLDSFFSPAPSTSSTPSSTFDRMMKSETKRTLKDTLKLLPDENLDMIPGPLIETYIEYAKQTCHPVLSEGAKETIKNFYKKLERSNGSEVNSIPVTMRQMEALLRMTLARARVDLQCEATEDHARDVVDIFNLSRIDMHSNDYGDVSNLSSLGNKSSVFSCSSINSNQSKSTQLKKFQEFLMNYAEHNQKMVFRKEELRELVHEFGYRDWYGIVESLNHNGFLLKMNSEMYKIVYT